MRWQTVDSRDDVFDGSDVYYQWRRGAGRTGEPAEDPWRPVLLRLKKDVSVVDFAAGVDGPADWSSHVRVSSLYREPAAGLEEARYITALVRERFFEELKSHRYARQRIERVAVLPPIMRDRGDDDPPSVPEPDEGLAEAPAPVEWPMSSQTVVMGVIDYGIAFAQARFRLHLDQTRIEALWVQDAPWPAGQVPGSAGKIGYGREIRKAEIDSLLAGAAHRGFIDEDQLYRDAAKQLGRRWLRSVSFGAAHGTHVMDLACGLDLDQNLELRSQRPIVCVQLPEASTADSSGENLDAYALDGIRYILDEADRIAAGRPLRVVINFSFGNVAGPHDGTADLERAIAEIIEKRRHKAPLDVVLPSGNSHLARLHAKIPFPHDKQAGSIPFDRHRVDLQWRVLPDDRTPSFVEIWLPRAWDAEKAPHPPTKSRVSLVITPPGLPPGPDSSPDLGEKQGQGVQLRSAQGDVLCEARYRYVGEPTDRGMFLIALQPTRSEARVPQGDRPVAPSGIWTITLQATSLAGAQPVQAWVQRDDTPYGFPRRGRQSYFDQPCYERFDAQGRVIVEDEKARPCVVTRSGSLNSIATGSGVTVVAGRVGSTGRLARYAGRESFAPLGRRTHVATEVSDESPVLVGVLGAGTRSGSRVRLNGTSVAAPQRSKKESEREGASVPYLAGSHT